MLVNNGLIEASEEEDEDDEKEPSERLLRVIELMKNVFEKQDTTIQGGRGLILVN